MFTPPFRQHPGVTTTPPHGKNRNPTSIAEKRMHPWKLTWNTIMKVWKMICLFKKVIFRFHVNFPGCRQKTPFFSTPPFSPVVLAPQSVAPFALPPSGDGWFRAGWRWNHGWNSRVKVIQIPWPFRDVPIGGLCHLGMRELGIPMWKRGPK